MLTAERLREIEYDRGALAAQCEAGRADGAGDGQMEMMLGYVDDLIADRHAPMDQRDKLLAACRALLLKLEDIRLAIGAPSMWHGDSVVCTSCGGAGWGYSDIKHWGGCPVLVAERGDAEDAAEAAIAKAEGGG